MTTRPKVSVILAGLIAIASLVSGCATWHSVVSAIKGGPSTAVIGGKTYAYGDEMHTASLDGVTTHSGRFCGAVLDSNAVTQFPGVRHFAVAAANPSRDCETAVNFFRDFIAADAAIGRDGFWQGMRVALDCGAVWRANACAVSDQRRGGFTAQTLNGTHTHYTDAEGPSGFSAIAMGF